MTHEIFTSLHLVYTLDARGICGIHDCGDNCKPPVWVAEVTAPTQKQAEAYARLFTTAPRLLAALKLCERALEERNPEVEEYAVKQARSAIAEVTRGSA